MRSILATAALALALGGCSTAQQLRIQQAAATPAGQLFCAIATTSGPIVAGMIQSGLRGDAAPIAIIATDKTRAYVDTTCAAAGGVPVSPPVSPGAAPQIAVAAPTAREVPG